MGDDLATEYVGQFAGLMSRERTGMQFLRTRQWTDLEICNILTRSLDGLDS